MIWRKGSLLWTSHAVVQIITTAVSFCFKCLLFSFYDSGYRWCACRPLYLYLANVFFFLIFILSCLPWVKIWLIVRLFARLSVSTSWGVSASFCSHFVRLKIIQCLLSYIIICWACISRRVTFFVRTSSHWYVAIMRQQFIMYKFNDYTFTDI